MDITLSTVRVAYAKPDDRSVVVRGAVQSHEFKTRALSAPSRQTGWPSLPSAVPDSISRTCRDQMLPTRPGAVFLVSRHRHLSSTEVRRSSPVAVGHQNLPGL